jgi:SAM-dependent methyltransferase
VRDGSNGWTCRPPYRWNLHRLLGGRRVLDAGCGIGRNLVGLEAGSVGVDHNPHSVEHCR